jgi:uncharacterized SAM-binding protein YcdF (DUF218 family)
MFAAPPEAQFALRLFETFGIARTRVVAEDKSRNTVENAVFSKALAQPKPGERWLLVTSAYHMPRSMAELEWHLPGVSLIAFPVVSDKLRAEPWWASLPTAKLLFSEYLKYILAQVRMRLEPAPEATGEARMRIGPGGPQAFR